MFQIVLVITMFVFSMGWYQQLEATQVVQPVPIRIAEQSPKYLHGLVRVAIKEAVGGVAMPHENQQPGHTAEDIIADITQSYLMPDPLKDERLFKLLDVSELSHRDKQQIKHLIEEGARLDTYTTKGETALMLLLKKDEYDLAALCVEMGANIEATDTMGNALFSYLFHAPPGEYDKQAGRQRTRADFEDAEKKRVFTILFGRKKESVAEQSFLKKFADASPEHGQFLERMRLIKLLIDHGLRGRRGLADKQSPLSLAVTHGDYYTVKALLLSHFEDSSAALHHALLQDDPLLVEELVKSQSQENVSPAVKKLLRNNARAAHADETVNFLAALDNQLLEAARRGDHQRVMELLQQGAYPDTKDELGVTPTIYAAEHGYLPVLRELIFYQADLDIQNNAGATALIIATLNNKPALVATLLEHDARLDIEDNSGKTFSNYGDLYPEASDLQRTIHRELDLKYFWHAVQKSDLPRVQSLLEEYPSFITAQKKGNNPLIVALLHGKQEVVRLLLAKGADPRSWSEDGHQALALAIGGGQIESSKALLAAGAYIDVPEDDGKTLQQLVIARNDPAMTQLFEAYVAWRDTVLKAFASRSAKNEVMLILQQGPALTMISDSEGNTLLMLALKRKYMKTAEFLLAHGAYINRGNKQGVTTLMQVAEAGTEHTIRFILEHHGAIDQQDNRGWTALTYALAHDHKAAAQLLLARGARLELTDREGRTLVQLFADKPEIVKLLQSSISGRAEKEQHAREVAETIRLHAMRHKIELDAALERQAQEQETKKRIQEQAGNAPKRQKLGN